MEENDFDGYEEICGTPSKNWMRGASVQLQHLDQVKSTKYNLGLTDPKSLKAGGKNAAVYQGQATGDGGAPNLDTMPPMAVHSNQQNAWGSNPSVPDLIKHQTERQRLPRPLKPGRPESAKVKRQTRPLSGKRIRPQSAKEPVNPYDSEVVRNEPKLFIGVNGTKYDFNDRLSDNLSVQSSMSSAWVSHPGAAALANKVIGSTIRNYMNGSGVSTPYTVDLEHDNDGPPPPPRGSPDFLQMMESENQLQESDMDYILNLEDGSPRAPPKPPTPEPIKFTIPKVEDDYDSDNEIQRAPSAVRRQPATYDQVPVNTPDCFLASDDVRIRPEPKKIVLNIANGYFDDPQTMMGGDQEAPPRRECHINEDVNTTYDITPRHKGRRPRSGKSPGRPRSGGRDDLRYVKSRIDSGVAAHASRSRPGSGKKAISTVTVNFLDDSGSDGDESKNKSKPGRPDIGNMLAGVKISEADATARNDEEEERPGSRPGSPSKQVSNVPRNYYEFAMQVKPGRGPAEKEAEKPMTITTKTLGLLGDNGRTVQEFKTVSVLNHNQTSKPKEYIAPRPPSAARKPNPVRPQSPPTKPQRRNNHEHVETQMGKLAAAEAGPGQVSGERGPSYPRGAGGRGDKDSIALKPGTIPNPAATKHLGRPTSAKPGGGGGGGSRPSSSMSVRGGGGEPASAVFVDRLNEVARSEMAELRPDSRIGYNVENMDSAEGNMANPGVLKKRRAGSAPSSRPPGAHTAAEPRYNLARNRPLSAQQAHVKNSDSNHSGHAHRHDALRNLHERAQNRNYANYSRRAAMPKKGKALPEKVIEIWTRRDDFTMETEGVKECKRMQDKLLDAGVPVTLETLTRGLLPPTEYGYSKPAVKTEMIPSLTPNYSSGLISKPEYWLVDEYKKLREAEKKVRQATAQLLAQEREEKMRAQSALSSGSSKKKGKGKRKSKSKSKKQDRTGSAHSVTSQA